MIASLRSTLVRSSLWMLANSAATRGLTFLTQIVLAWILTKSEFGIYAAAISISAVVTALRGGGMPQWLIQGGEERLDERSGPAFWLSLTFNFVLGGALLAIALPAGAFYGEREISTVLLVTGASFPLITWGTHYKSSLAVKLHMRSVALIEIASAILRYSSIVILALFGFGALSFVVPLPLVYVTEGLLGYLITRDRAWRRAARVHEWLKLIGRGKWIMLGTLVITISLQIDFIVLGRLVSLSTLGIYYFAFQLTYMSASIVTENARRVLFPGLVAVPAERRPAAALQASTVCTALGSPILMLVGVMIAPLEAIVWGGRWESAVVPVQLLTLALPLQLMTTVTQSSLLSDARFRLWTAVNGMRALIVASSAAVAGILFATHIDAIAAAMSVGYASANLIQVLVVYQAQGVTVGRVIATSISGVFLAPAAAIATIATMTQLDAVPTVELLVSALMFLALWLAASATFDRKELRYARTVVRGAFRR